MSSDKLEQEGTFSLEGGLHGVFCDRFFHRVNIASNQPLNSVISFQQVLCRIHEPIQSQHSTVGMSNSFCYLCCISPLGASLLWTSRGKTVYSVCFLYCNVWGEWHPQIRKLNIIVKPRQGTLSLFWLANSWIFRWILSRACNEFTQGVDYWLPTFFCLCSWIQKVHLKMVSLYHWKTGSLWKVN